MFRLILVDAEAKKERRVENLTLPVAQSMAEIHACLGDYDLIIIVPTDSELSSSDLPPANDVEFWGEY